MTLDLQDREEKIKHLIKEMWDYNTSSYFATVHPVYATKFGLVKKPSLQLKLLYR